MSEQTKFCSKCGAAKRLCSNGRVICDPCNRARALAYRAANIDAVREKDRIRVAAMSAEKKRAKHQRWRDKNREHVRAYAMDSFRKQYKINPEKFRARRIGYHIDNRQKVIERLAHDREKLSDAYIRTSLRIRKHEADICPDIVELKRNQILLFRLTSKIKKEIENV